MRIGTLGYKRDAPLYEGLPYARRFARYAALFDTVELPSTRNRVPSWRTVSRWRARAPEGFRYSFLAPKHLRYTPSGTERRALRRFLRRHRALGAARGAVRFQLPEDLDPEAFAAWLQLLAEIGIPGEYAFETPRADLARRALEAGHAVVNHPEGPFLYLIDPPRLPEARGYAYFSRLEDALHALKAKP